MEIVVLDGGVLNPGDLSWDPLSKLGTVRIYERTSPQEFAERVRNAQIAITNKIVWDARALDMAPDLKMIALTSTGFNTVDLAHARARHIVVCNAPSYSTPDVAQMTIALLLELCLHVGLHSRIVLEGEWTQSADFSFWKTPLIELADKTMGIVGMGHIGQDVAKIARAFGMTVVFYNPHPKPECEIDGMRQVSFDELLRSCDIVSLHLPAAPDTDGLMNAKTLAEMKDGAILLNTARGTLVDESAVAHALETGKLGGFGADVVSVEPMRPDNPLLNAKSDNIVITPHIAWATKEARTRLLNATIENVRDFIDGHPQNVVD